MKHLDLFSGIGGFALAAEMVWPDVEHTFCDNDPFAQAILKKHWPDSKIYGDIRTITANTHHSNGQTRADEKEGEQGQQSTQPVSFGRNQFDLLTGGFPCQPFSQAGRRRGTADDRHLWPEMLRVIRDFHPRWIIGENVGGFVTWSEGMVLEQVHVDLEGEGYEVQSFIIPAVALNAPHRRDRVWIVAYLESARRDEGRANAGGLREGKSAMGQTKRRGPTDEDSHAHDPEHPRLERQPRANKKSQGRQGAARPDAAASWQNNWPEVAARLCALDDGLPGGLARPRGWRNAALKGAGNAIVPQVAAEIMRAIQQSS